MKKVMLFILAFMNTTWALNLKDLGKIDVEKTITQAELDREQARAELTQNKKLDEEIASRKRAEKGFRYQKMNEFPSGIPVNESQSYNVFTE